MVSSTLFVHHLHVRYLVPGRHGDPGRIQRRLDHVGRKHLATAWEHCFQPSPNSNEPLLFIERMEVDISLDGSKTEDQTLATAWARQTAQQIERAVAHDQVGLVKFRDRAHFLASFLGDLLRGSASSRWYYAEFEPLRTLGPGQIAVEVLGADSDAGRDALIELAREGNLERLLLTLTDNQVEAVVPKCLLPDGPRVFIPGRVMLWVAALRAFLGAKSFVFSPLICRDVARLYLGLLIERPEIGPDTNLARFLCDLLQLRQIARQLRDAQALYSALEARTSAAQFGRLGLRSGKVTLMTLRRELPIAEVQALLRDLQIGSPEKEGQRIASAFGGVFLLAPSVIDLKLHELLARAPFPNTPGADKSAWLLYAITLQCLGINRTESTCPDPAPALFAGLAGAPSPSALQHYTDSITPAVVNTFASLLEEHLAQSVRRLGVLGRAAAPSAQPSTTAALSSLTALDASVIANPTLDAALQPASAAVLRLFAHRLGAFADSSPEFLRRNFLETRAEIELQPKRMAVCFVTCPLRTVLRMAGFDHTSWTLPWLGDRELTFHFEP